MSFCYLAIIVALFSPPAYNYASVIKKGSSTVSYKKKDSSLKTHFMIVQTNV